MTKSILMAGVGGQGTILMSKVLSEGLVRAGYDVKMCEIHGMAQRGGSVTTQIRFGEKVYSTCIGLGDADVLVAFEKAEAARFLPHLKPGGTLIVNDLEIYSLPVLTGEAIYPERLEEQLRCAVPDAVIFNANEAAVALGNAKAQNMVLLGLVVNALGLEHLDWETVICMFLPEKLRVLNIEAYRTGLNSGLAKRKKV